MIGIIGAMVEEVNEIKKIMVIYEEKNDHGYTFFVGKMNNIDIVLLQGGIGKVNATIATMLLLTHYDIDYVINIGSAGGLYPNQNIGDIVISTHVIHHDVDVTAFGHELGKVPGMPCAYEANQHLLDKVQTVLEAYKYPAHVGAIASGDQFISNPEQFQRIKDNFPDVICVDMEAAAIAQVCYIFQKKFIITRSLSDIYGKGDHSIQFDEYLKKASSKSAQMCYELVSSLS